MTGLWHDPRELDELRALLDDVRRARTELTAEVDEAATVVKVLRAVLDDETHGAADELRDLIRRARREGAHLENLTDMANGLARTLHERRGPPR